MKNEILDERYREEEKKKKILQNIDISIP